MAKTTGPLFSMDASGKFGGALVFTKWKGRPVVRQLVVPSNPRTLTQNSARNDVRITAEMQKFVNRTARKMAGQTFTDKIRLRDDAPAGQAWNGHLVKSAIGTGGANMDAAKAIWAAMDATPQGQWGQNNIGLDFPFAAVIQKGAGVTNIAAVTGAQVFFLYIYALYIAGLAALPGNVPPNYA